MSRLKSWISAFRLRTLALSFALIITGSAIARTDGTFSIRIFLLALATTLFLQILSNLSNDYGDAVSGVDSDRVGPQRAVQSGAITREEMKRGMMVSAILSLVAGVALLAESLPRIGGTGGMVMLGVGILCIIAAITYTVGKHPYGYIGLGDIGVFIFFGLVGVVGSHMMHAGAPRAEILMPATAIGLLSMGVLNMNNLRDHDGDARTGKRTLVVRFGTRWSKTYQTIIITASCAIWLAYIAKWGTALQFSIILPMPILIRHLKTIWTTEDVEEIDKQLKTISLTTMAMSILFFAFA